MVTRMLTFPPATGGQRGRGEQQGVRGRGASGAAPRAVLRTQPQPQAAARPLPAGLRLSHREHYVPIQYC